MSGKPRKKLTGSQAATLTVPDGIEAIAVARLIAVVAKCRVDTGRGPTWKQAAMVLGVERREAGQLLLELRERGFVTFDRQPGSLRLPDDAGVAAWTIRTLKRQSA